MWPFNRRSKRIKKAFLAVCQRLPNISTVWSTLGTAAPRIRVENDVTVFIHHHGSGILSLVHRVMDCDMTPYGEVVRMYPVDTHYMVFYIGSSISVIRYTGASPLHLSRFDTLRFLESLTPGLRQMTQGGLLI